MNSTAAAVIVIVFAALALAMMAGIAGYTLGRAFATDDAKKASKTTDERLNETLVVLKSDTLVVSQLLSFTQERAFDYRRIAEDALAYLPDGLRKDILGRELKTTDKKMCSRASRLKTTERSLRRADARLKIARRIGSTLIETLKY